MFCNIYLWFNFFTMFFFLCVFVFHFVLFLVNSTLVIFVVPYKYSFCLLVKGINLLGWFPLQCAANLFHDLLLTFLFLSFPFLSFPSFLHLPTLSFPKLLATSQIKSLGFQSEFCFWKFILPPLSSLFSESSDFESLSSPFFFIFLFMCFFFVLKTCFLCFIFLSHDHGFSRLIIM